MPLPPPSRPSGHTSDAVLPPVPTPRATRHYRRCNVWLALGLLAAFPLAWVLPQWTAWENGLWEWVQNFTLAAGFFSALAMARRSSGGEGCAGTTTTGDSSLRALCIIAALFWLAFFGREASWGATFMPSTTMTEWGPSWRSAYLWYRPAVPYVVGGMVAAVLYLFVRHRVWSRALLPLVRGRMLPGTALALFVACMVVSTNAEGHGFIHLQSWYGHQVMVLEELVECLGFLALLLAQHRVIGTLASRRVHGGL